MYIILNKPSDNSNFFKLILYMTHKFWLTFSILKRIKKILFLYSRLRINVKKFKNLCCRRWRWFFYDCQRTISWLKYGCDMTLTWHSYICDMRELRLLYVYKLKVRWLSNTKNMEWLEKNATEGSNLKKNISTLHFRNKNMSLFIHWPPRSQGLNKQKH